MPHPVSVITLSQFRTTHLPPDKFIYSALSTTQYKYGACFWQESLRTLTLADHPDRMSKGYRGPVKIFMNTPYGFNSWTTCTVQHRNVN